MQEAALEHTAETRLKTVVVIEQDFLTLLSDLRVVLVDSPSSQAAPLNPGQHFHSREVTVRYTSLYEGLTTVL